MNWVSQVKYMILLLVFSTQLRGQEDTKYLFYCNESLEIETIWPLSRSNFVAHIAPESKRPRSGEQFLLFNRSRLVTDTLIAEGGIFNHFVVLDQGEFIITTTLKTHLYKVVDDKFELISSTKNPSGLATLMSSDFSDYPIGEFLGFELGYESSAKDRTKKRSKKNIPRYYYKVNGQKEWVNSGKEEVAGDQWESFMDKTFLLLGDVTQFKESVYFNIPMAGRCYILNAQSKKVKTLLYPSEGAKSWYLTIDRVKGSHYLVGQTKDKVFKIYHVNLETGKRTYLKDVTHFYDMIIDDKVLIKKEVKEGKKKFNCFYLKPLYGEFD